MSSHPPLFAALARRLSPRHSVNVLARRLAHREDDLITKINLASARRDAYRPRGWNEPHEKDWT